MRVPLEWLKEYVTVRLSPEALAKKLTMAGLEVVDIAEVDGQAVLECEITPNRPDWLSILGVAREVAALTGETLKLPSAGRQGPAAHNPAAASRVRGPGAAAAIALAIHLADRQGCQRYVGRVIDGVRLKASPEWMQRRLAACGIRPISNVVDVTNYVLLECGQPLHAFDYETIQGGTIFVRRAQAGESLAMLDGQTRRLPPETLVIADGKRAIAVAGVMGGSETAVGERTVAVLLESALFDPLSVRRTARALGLTTESSYRFERGMDPEGVDAASERAGQLIQELAGGRLALVQAAGAEARATATISVHLERANRWLGTQVKSPEARALLVQRGCRVVASSLGNVLQVTPPSYRRDLAIEADVYEELARGIGYEHIPSTVPVGPVAQPRAEGTRAYETAQGIRRLCAGLGLTETISWSLLSAADLSCIGHPAAQAIRLANPLSQDHAYLRPTLTVGLLQSARRNLTTGTESLRFFELGSVFVCEGTDAAKEVPRLGLAVSGCWLKDWTGERPADWFQLKGLIDSLVRRLSDQAPQWVPVARPWMAAGQGASVRLNGQAVGILGQVSADVARALDLPQPVWLAELDLEVLASAHPQRQEVEPPPPFPPVKRDLSFYIKVDVPYESVEETIREAGAPQLARAVLIDRYQGERLPAGQHSLTFSLEYRHPERTLTSAEVEQVHQRIVQSLAQSFGATVR